MKISEVKKLVQEQIEIAYRTAYDNAAKVIGSRKDELCSDVEHWGELDLMIERIRALPIPTVIIVRPETAALHPEKLTPHTIIAGQGLHPETDEIIDRKKMVLGSNYPGLIGYSCR